MEQDKRKLLLVTGLSGAGLSTGLKALEDGGYKVIDNLPLSLLDALLTQEGGRGKPVAVGVDSRTWDFSAEALLATAVALKQREDLQAELVFIDCQDAVLQQRFTETRRVHPLAVDRPVADGVAAERGALEKLREAADHIIDTTDFSVHDLRRLMAARFPVAGTAGLTVFVMSFGFKNGLPREADMVFDLRFLDNPHWDPALRPLTGLDPAVAAKVAADRDWDGFFKNVTALLAPLLPRYRLEGRHYLTVALGCTGGKHRSVFAAETLHRWLLDGGHAAAVRHRDLERIREKEGRKAA